MSPPTIASMLKLGTSWFTGQGCKQHAIKRARDLGHSVILGWTHPQGARYHGSYSATTDMLEHCSDPSTPHALHDLEGLYHVTMDDQPYPPYFDVEWTSTEVEAYPWLSREGIIRTYAQPCGTCSASA